MDTIFISFRYFFKRIILIIHHVDYNGRQTEEMKVCKYFEVQIEEIEVHFIIARGLCASSYIFM